MVCSCLVAWLTLPKFSSHNAVTKDNIDEATGELKFQLNSATGPLQFPGQLTFYLWDSVHPYVKTDEFDSISHLPNKNHSGRWHKYKVSVNSHNCYLHFSDKKNWDSEKVNSIS